MIWLGDGAGNWTVHQFGNFGYGGCALGNLDHDGLTDIAWGVHHNWGSGEDGAHPGTDYLRSTSMRWSRHGWA